MLAAWLAGVMLAIALCMADVLPMPFTHTANTLDFRGPCPLGFWAGLFGLLGTVFGALAAPHLPKCFCTFRAEHVFLDGVCINQADQLEKERGIYGIGGFLSVSQELKVLWSSPYLSSLWCMFELAAYSKANPKGKITLAPLFVEQALVVMWLGWNFMFLVMWAGLATDLLSNGRFWIAFLALPLFLPFLQALRREFAVAAQLLQDLEHFDLANARCCHDFDRQFVESAIEAWYGTLEDFTQYVRGPLRRELVANEASMDASSLAYCLLVATPVWSISIEQVLALVLGGAPLQSIISEIFGFTFGIGLWFLVCLKLLFYMCKVYAARHPCRAADYCKTVGIALAFFVCITLGAAPAILILNRSLIGAFAVAVFALAISVRCFGYDVPSLLGKSLEMTESDEQSGSKPIGHGMPGLPSLKDIDLSDELEVPPGRSSL